jgi:hypothetical protein
MAAEVGRESQRDLLAASCPCCSIASNRLGRRARACCRGPTLAWALRMPRVALARRGIARSVARDVVVEIGLKVLLSDQIGGKQTDVAHSTRRNDDAALNDAPGKGQQAFCGLTAVDQMLRAVEVFGSGPTAPTRSARGRSSSAQEQSAPLPQARPTPLPRSIYLYSPMLGWRARRSRADRRISARLPSNADYP